MAWRQRGTKPLPEPMMICYVDSMKQTSMAFESDTKMPFKQMHLKMSSVEWRPFCPDFRELTRWRLLNMADSKQTILTAL